MVGIKFRNSLLSIKKYNTARVVGIQSTAANGEHVLFLDFDNKPLKKVFGLCKELQERYKLGNFYVLRSSPGHYHAICIDKLKFGQVCQIQHELGMDKYIAFSAKRGYWVLRISGKGNKKRPELLKILHSANNKNWKSYGHWKWLHARFPITVPDRLDGNNVIKYDIYRAVV